jgi:hypothetical protein
MQVGIPCVEFIDLLASVGMTHCSVTYLSLQSKDSTGSKIGGEKKYWKPGLSTEYLRARLPGMIDYADRHEFSVVAAHPKSDGIRFIQLDDLTSDEVFMLTPVSFATLETSPGSYQIWIAMNQEEEAGGDYRNRLRKGVGSDQSASESTRIPGSHNFKAWYKDANGYPVVKVIHSEPGRIASGEELEATGLLAERAQVKENAPNISSISASTGTGRRPNKWPEYRGNEAGVDRSVADFNFALAALSWEWSHGEVVDQLDKISARRFDRGEAAWRREVERTVANAGKMVRPNPRFTAPREPQNTSWGSGQPLAKVSDEVCSSGLSRDMATEAASPSPPGGLVSLVETDTSPRPAVYGWASPGVREAEMFAFCSTNDDAFILYRLTGLETVALGSVVPKATQERVESSHVIIATRTDEIGEALARELTEVCARSASLKRVPYPSPPDEAALRAAFLWLQNFTVQELSRKNSEPDDLLAYAGSKIWWHSDWPEERPSAFPTKGFAYYENDGEVCRYEYDENVILPKPIQAVEIRATPVPVPAIKDSVEKGHVNVCGGCGQRFNSKTEKASAALLQEHVENKVCSHYQTESEIRFEHVVF